MPQLFGEKLRYLRKNQGITQGELARQLGLASHSHIAKLETGQGTAALELITHIAISFSVRTDYLLRDSIAVTDAQTFLNHQPSEEPRLLRFGENLRMLRQQRQLSQTDLARELGIARRGYISNLEAGRKMPSPDLLVAIADYFEMTTEVLLYGSSVEEQP